MTRSSGSSTCCSSTASGRKAMTSIDELADFAGLVSKLGPNQTRRLHNLAKALATANAGADEGEGPTGTGAALMMDCLVHASNVLQQVKGLTEAADWMLSNSVTD